MEWLLAWLVHPLFGMMIRVAILLGLVLPLVLFLATLIKRSADRRFGAQGGMIAGKVVIYGGVALIAVMVLREFGFELAALLGAAGIAAVAIGFAAQTSLSNVISGGFLIAERPFKVGDVIKVGDEIGIVLSIDLLSVKVRAPDNRFIRIPNENVIKGQVINITRFPIRRVDVTVGVAYKEDPERVMAVLKDVAREQPLIFDDPEPILIFQGFGASSQDFMLGAWCQKADFLKAKNGLMAAIKKRFDAEHIEIPFPHMSLYSGTVSEPFPIRLVGDGIPQAGAAANDG